MLAAGGNGIPGFEEEGAGGGLVKDGDAVPGGGVSEYVGAAALYVKEPHHRLLGGRFLHQRQPGAILGYAVLRHVPKGVNLPAGKVVDGKG